MNSRAPILGIAALVFIGFALISHWMTYDPAQGFFTFGWYSMAHLAIGAVALIGYLTTGSSSLVDFVRQRSTRYGLNALVYSIVFVALIGMANFLSARYHARWDMSVEDVNTLSPQSIEIVEGLETEITAQAFVEGGSDAVLDELLSAYEEASEQFSFRIIDPQVSPELAQKAAISQLPSVRLEAGEKSTVVTRTDEEAITNGIHLITRATAKKIYFIEGHGEADIDDKRSPTGLGLLSEALRNQNYTVQRLALFDAQTVPDDADVVVITAAERAYFPRELEALGAYALRGGRLLVLTEPKRNDELMEFLSRFGIEAGDNVIVDRQMRLFQGATLGLDPVVSDYSDHPAVAPMTDRTVFSLARSVRPAENVPKGVVAKTLAVTPKTSWAETDLETLFESSEASLDEGDLPGPVSIAAAASAYTSDLGGEEDGEFQMVVFGDTTFATNRYLRQLFNDALVLAATGWLAGEDELISIGSRAVRASRATLSADEARTVFYISVLVLPELILLAGVAVWWRRSSV